MERKFYRIDLGDLHRFFLHENFKNRNNYNSKCYGGCLLKDIVVQRKTLFRKEEILKLFYRLYCYEENGVFYEFFSGEQVGKRKVLPQTSVYRDADELERNGYVLTSFQDFGTLDHTIRELSAASFADEVRRYVPYKTHMATEMSRLLAAIDARYKYLRDIEDKKNNAAIRKEQNSKSWLDDIINRR